MDVSQSLTGTEGNELQSMPAPIWLRPFKTTLNSSLTLWALSNKVSNLLRALCPLSSFRVSIRTDRAVRTDGNDAIFRKLSRNWIKA